MTIHTVASGMNSALSSKTPPSSWISTIRFFATACLGAALSTLITAYFGLDEATHARVTLICVPIIIILLYSSGPTAGHGILESHALATQQSRREVPSIFGRGRRWGTIGFVLLFGIATSSASMRVSPMSDIVSPAGVILIIGCIAAGYWEIQSLRSARGSKIGIYILLGAVAFHLVLWDAFESQLISAESNLSKEAVRRAVIAFEQEHVAGDKTTAISNELPSTSSASLATEQISIGTLSLLALEKSDEYSMVWRRKSIWDRFLPSQASVEVGSYLLGRTSAISSSDMIIRRLSADPAATAQKVKVIVRPGAELPKIGSPVIVQSTVEVGLVIGMQKAVFTEGSGNLNGARPILALSDSSAIQMRR